MTYAENTRDYFEMFYGKNTNLFIYDPEFAEIFADFAFGEVVKHRVSDVRGQMFFVLCFPLLLILE